MRGHLSSYKIRPLCVFVCVSIYVYKQHTLTPASGTVVVTMYICHSAAFGWVKSQSLSAREGHTNQTDSLAYLRGQPAVVTSRSAVHQVHHAGVVSTWYSFSTNDGSAQPAPRAERQKRQVITSFEYSLWIGFILMYINHSHFKIESNVLLLK